MIGWPSLHVASSRNATVTENGGPFDSTGSDASSQRTRAPDGVTLYKPGISMRAMSRVAGVSPAGANGSWVAGSAGYAIVSVPLGDPDTVVVGVGGACGCFDGQPLARSASTMTAAACRPALTTLGEPDRRRVEDAGAVEREAVYAGRDGRAIPIEHDRDDRHQAERAFLGAGVGS